jgi:hypothetical protein
MNDTWHMTDLQCTLHCTALRWKQPQPQPTSAAAVQCSRFSLRAMVTILSPQILSPSQVLPGRFGRITAVALPTCIQSTSYI